MPIEHINKTDTLNEGRVKLNAAIDGANAADVTSKAADTKATQALANSESTQTQLDTIVIDGDSSVEAAQARVDEKGVPHPTLKARIDDGLNSVNQQLAEKAAIDDVADITVNIKLYSGLVVDDNWTQALDSAIARQESPNVLLSNGSFIIDDINLKDNVVLRGSQNTVIELKNTITIDDLENITFKDIIFRPQNVSEETKSFLDIFKSKKINFINCTIDGMGS